MSVKMITKFRVKGCLNISRNFLLGTDKLFDRSRSNFKIFLKKLTFTLIGSYSKIIPKSFQNFQITPILTKPRVICIFKNNIPTLNGRCKKGANPMTTHLKFNWWRLESFFLCPVFPVQFCLFSEVQNGRTKFQDAMWNSQRESFSEKCTKFPQSSIHSLTSCCVYEVGEHFLCIWAIKHTERCIVYVKIILRKKFLVLSKWNESYEL